MKEKIVLSELQTKARMKNGLECQVCGCRDIRVYHTDSRQTKVIRHRKCRNCGKTFTTIERVVRN